MTATNTQVQNFVDGVIRPGCQKFAALCTFLDLAGAQIGDIAANLADPDTTWTDGRKDGPPHLATTADILTIGTALASFRAFRNGTGTAQDSANMAAAMPVILSLCVNVPLNG